MLPSFAALKDRFETARPGPFYGALVVGSAMFLITLSVCRWGSDTYVAEAQMTLTRKSLDSAWPSTKHWEQILTRSVSQETSPPVGDPPLGDPPLGETAAQKNLPNQSISLRIEADSTPLFLNFSLLCIDHRPERAISRVNQVGRQLMKSNFILGTTGLSLTDTNWHMVPAKKAARKIAPLRLPTILFCLLIAAIATIPMLIDRYRRGVLQTKKAVETLLQTRVIAHVPLPAKNGSAPVSQTKNFFHHTCMVGEWALIVMLLATLAVSVIDKHFAHQFISQPVTALADSVRQLTVITWS